jgi:hypothetical protein
MFLVIQQKCQNIDSITLWMQLWMTYKLCKDKLQRVLLYS